MNPKYIPTKEMQQIVFDYYVEEEGLGDDEAQSLVDCMTIYDLENWLTVAFEAS